VEVAELADAVRCVHQQVGRERVVELLVGVARDHAPAQRRGRDGCLESLDLDLVLAACVHAGIVAMRARILLPP
jgi:hypothetical protein